MRLLASLCVPALALAFARGCPVESHSCTAIGCSDGVTLRLRTAGDPWVHGEYALRFITPAATHACVLRVPEDLPDPPGSFQPLACTPELGASASLSAEIVCTEQRSGDAVSQSCTPVPGRFVLEARFDATPESLTVIVERDGTPLIDETLAPAYEASRPNGPGCDPVCRQASVEVTLP